MHLTEEDLLNKYISFNKPIPYKSFLIYPIKLKDTYDVQDILNLLQVDKNILGNIELITMSNLRFILMTAYVEDKYRVQLDYLLRITLNIDDDKEIQIYADDHSEKILIGKKLTEIHGHVILEEASVQEINADDFDEIKRIILYQNIIDYTDKYIDPDVRKATEEYYRLKNKGAIHVPLEHKMMCVQFKTGMSIEEIGNLTIRNFHLLFNIIVDESDYMALKIAEYNDAKFNSPIENWVYKARKDKYAEAFCDADAFTDKVQSIN